MNLEKTIMERYGSEICLLAGDADGDETAAIIKAVQDSWDRGAGFTAVTTFTGRKEDSDEEIAAACECAIGKMSILVKKAWAKKLSREDAVAIINGLSAFSTGGRIVVCHGVNMGPHDIIDLWNNTHPDAAPLIPAPAFEL